MLLLDDDFQPGSFDVICGRGKKCYAHAGNMRFRNKVARHLEQYTASRTKDEKSHVVMMVVNEVRRESPYGGFVKQNVSSGEWYEVGDLLAREKTSQAFRDCLSDQYKSSTVSRRKKRQADRVKTDAAAAAPRKMRRTEPDETLVLVDTTLSFSDPSAKSSSPSNYKNTSQDGDGERMHHSKRLQQQHRASIISISEMLLTDTSFLDDLENLDDIWDDDDEQQPSSSKPSARVSVAPLPGAHQQEASSSSRRRSSLISIANIFAVMQEEKSSSSPARVSMNMGMTTTTSRRTSVTAARRRSSLISLASIRAAVMDTSTTTTAVDYSHDDTLEDMLRALGGDEDCWQPDTAMSCTQPSQ